MGEPQQTPATGAAARGHTRRPVRTASTRRPGPLTGTFSWWGPPWQRGSRSTSGTPRRWRRRPLGLRPPRTSSRRTVHRRSVSRFRSRRRAHAADDREGNTGESADGIEHQQDDHGAYSHRAGRGGPPDHPHRSLRPSPDAAIASLVATAVHRHFTARLSEARPDSRGDVSVWPLRPSWALRPHERPSVCAGR
jgi:hypothetical protein